MHSITKVPKYTYWIKVILVNIILDFVGYWASFMGIGFMITTSARGGFISGDGSFGSIFWGFLLILVMCAICLSVNRSIFNKWIKGKSKLNWYFLLPLIAFVIIGIVLPAQFFLG